MLLGVGHGAGVLVYDGGGGAARVVGGAAGVRVAVVHRRLGPRPPPRAGGSLLDLQRAVSSWVSERDLVKRISWSSRSAVQFHICIPIL